MLEIQHQITKTEIKDNIHSLYRKGYSTKEIKEWFDDKNIIIGKGTILTHKPKSVKIRKSRESHHRNDQGAKTSYS